jgi:predicted  nucleic acid-binding Zn-ribbon protein
LAETSEQFARLLAVQDDDTSIDQLVHRRGTLTERSELAAAEAQMSGLNQRRAAIAEVRDGLGARQAALEEQIGGSRTRSAEIVKRLYSGQVTAARDLQAMDEEVKHLATHVSELEDREIEVMEELEPLDADLAVIDGELDRLSKDAESLRASIAEAESEIDTELARERAERAAIAADVPADLLSRYEQLRKKLGGTGAARLVGGSCGGCHLQLPAMELDRVKKAPPDAIVYCDQCGRILVR